MYLFLNAFLCQVCFQMYFIPYMMTCMITLVMYIVIRSAVSPSSTEDPKD